MTQEELNQKVWLGQLGYQRIFNLTVKGFIPHISNRDGTFSYNDDTIKKWERSFIGAYLSKNPTRTSILESIKRALGYYPDWQDFTKQNILRIIRQLENDFSKGSAKMYAALIRSVLNDWSEDADIPCKDMRILSLKREATMNVFLTKEEISTLEQYSPKNERETVVLAQFLVSCYTGARHSDVKQISDVNINNGHISYVSKKTGILSTIPAHKGLDSLIKASLLKEYTDTVFCSEIKQICFKAGIRKLAKIFRGGKYEEGEKWQFISSHTARRSFVTNLYLLGADIYDISKMAGHTSVEMTERYICCEMRKLPDKVMDYFR